MLTNEPTTETPAIILSPSNMHAAIDPDGVEVYCDRADRPAMTNDGFCQFCGSTEHRPIADSTAPTAIDHDDQLQRLIDAYERPVLNALHDERYSHTTVGHVRGLVRQGIAQAFDAGHACSPGHADQPWKDFPATHTTGMAIAAKLHAVAKALESLGDTEIAPVWINLGLQVTGRQDPAGRKAAVDAIAAALQLPAKADRDGSYGTNQFKGVNVYTPTLHQPGCCEHCTAAAS